MHKKTRGFIIFIGCFLALLSIATAGQAALGSFFDWKKRAAEPSRSAFAHRGFLIDMAGHKHRDEAYFKLVERLAQCGYNVLYLRLADNNGCAIELRSYPELASANAMSQATLKKLLAQAQGSGIQVIPVIEMWGRAFWILKHHPELMDERNPLGLKSGLGQSMTIQQEIIGEIAGLFASSAYLHLGVGGVMPSLESLPAHQRASEVQRHIEHLNVLCRMVDDHDKTPMMWAGQFIKHPELLSQLGTHVQLIIDLDREENAGEVIDRMRAKGITLIAASSLADSQSLIFPAEADFERQREVTRLVCEKKMAGLVTTFYKPQRMFPGTLSHALYYSGRLDCDSSAGDREAAMARFASTYFATAMPEVGQALAELCRIDNRMEAMDASYWRDRESFMARLTDEARATDMEFANRAHKISGLLESAAGKIGDHEEDYEAYCLLAGFMEYLARRRLLPSNVNAMVDKARNALASGSRDRAVADMEAARESVKKLEKERVKMIERLEKNWAKSRYPEPPALGGDFRENLLEWVTSDKTNSYGAYELYETLTQLIGQARKGGELVLTPPDNR